MQTITTPVDRVKHTLAQHGVSSDIITLEQSAHTAEQAAQALHCDAAQIVKSLIFKTSQTEKTVLALIGGDKRLDSEKLALLTNEQLGKADADFVKQKTGFSIGGVSPIGALEQLPVYMDQTLLKHESVWAAAGHPKSVFNIDPHRLAQIAQAVIADLT